MVKTVKIAALIMSVAASLNMFAACADQTSENPSDGTVTETLPENTGNENSSENIGSETPTIPEESTETEEAETPEDPTEEESNILIVYFSYSGNTETEANYIYSQIGGTLHEIEPVTPYPTTSYTIWGYDARDERDNDARPAIKDPLLAEEVAKYNTVFIGFPIWWHTAPMIIGTFLEAYTWGADVDIYPFFQGASNSTQEYYDNSMTFIKRCAAGATVHDGLYASHTNTTAINTYLKNNGFID